MGRYDHYVVTVAISLRPRARETLVFLGENGKVLSSVDRAYAAHPVKSGGYQCRHQKPWILAFSGKCMDV